MIETTQKKIIAKVGEVQTNGDGTRHATFLLDEEISIQPGQYIIFTFEKDDKSFEHKHTIKNIYTNTKNIEEDVRFENIEEEFFLPVLKKDETFTITGPFNFSLKEKLDAKFSLFISGGVRNKLVILISVICLLVVSFFIKDFIGKISNPKLSVDDVILLSTTGENQKPLQDFFVQQVKSGKNDDSTKAAIFWITHRFFDNGGNIYEIYDFINANKEISFLKEAEKIYPDAFQSIKDRKATAYDGYSTLALMAYFEIAVKHHYGNLAMLGLTANKYAELAYGYKIIADENKDQVTKNKQLEIYYKFLKYSKTYTILADEYIKGSIKNSGKIQDIETSGLQTDEILVGLNQYASAQLLYRGMGQQMPSIFEPQDIFAFNSEFSKRKLPSLYFFTNYLWATSLVNAGQANMMTVSVPIANVIEYAHKNGKKGIVLRLINANKGRESSVFSHDHAKKLAAVSKPFKAWLIESGWKDNDFK